MTYAEAIQFLYGLRWFGAKFGLENTTKLAALAGHPQNRLRFIHVAGTNGKGSTCAMLESIYRAAGLRVGLFTSPHLVSFRERIQVDRHLIPENEIIRLVAEFQSYFKEFPADHHPTFFEAVTVMALRYFAEQRCDLVIWETGLGGRLDATNIVTPLASVITNIGYDHQQWLGETLAQIATEKAGIIKPGVPALTTTDEPEALAVIEATALKLGAPLTHVSLSPSSLNLLGEHQQRNASLAVATVEVLQREIPISAESIQKGLATVQWPGRMQLVTRPNGRKILLDGAHNLAGAKTLTAALKQNFPGTKPALILGILQDKNWREICVELAPLAARILTVPVASERTADARQLAATCHEIRPDIQVNSCASLAEALEQSNSAPFVLIAGSLYLIGEAMELLRLTETPISDEKSLNEWTAKKA